jgi:hypothetical protein
VAGVLAPLRPGYPRWFTLRQRAGLMNQGAVSRSRRRPRYAGRPDADLPGRPGGSEVRVRW